MLQVPRTKEHNAVKTYETSLHYTGQRNMIAGLLKGAVAGAVGVWALDRVDWFNWNHEHPRLRARTRRVRPGGEPPAAVAASKLEDAADVELSDSQHRAAGMAIHYSLGIGLGALYGALRRRAPAIGAARGTLFGAALFVVEDELFGTVTGLAAMPGDYPWQDHARGLVAHLVYGIVTDTVLRLLDD